MNFTPLTYAVEQKDLIFDNLSIFVKSRQIKFVAVLVPHFIHIMKILSLNVCITIKPNEKWLFNICRNVDDVTNEWFKVHTKLDDCYFMLISGVKRPTMYKWTRLNIRGNIQHFCTFNWMIPNVISSDEFILTSAVCKGFLWHQLF